MIGERVRLFKMLGDKSRLKIVNSLMKEPMYVELISERLGLNASTVSFHLKKLEHIGLVRSEKDQYYTMYYLDKSKLDFNLLEEIETYSSKALKEDRSEENYYKKIVSTFMVANKLKSIPVQRKKRQVILKEIAKSFKYDKLYKEKEVNEIIKEFHEDFCFIRREFIMEKLFTRENGIYQKIKM